MRQLFDGDLMYDHAGSRDVSTEKRQAKQDLRKRVWHMVRLLPPHIYTRKAASELDQLLQQDEGQIDGSDNPHQSVNSKSEMFLWTMEERALEEIPLSERVTSILRRLDQARRDIVGWMNAHKNFIPLAETAACQRIEGKLSLISKCIKRIDCAHTLLEKGSLVLGHDALTLGGDSLIKELESLSKQIVEHFRDDHPVSVIAMSVLDGGHLNGRLDLFVFKLKKGANVALSDALYRLERIESEQE